MADGNSKKNLVCLYCQKLLRGGGISRMKSYLAGIKGEVEACKNIIDDVR